MRANIFRFLVIVTALGLTFTSHTPTLETPADVHCDRPLFTVCCHGYISAHYNTTKTYALFRIRHAPRLIHHFFYTHPKV